MKKKLFATGAFVCEYESTGDNQKDMELCREILIEKGLHREVSVTQAIFRQAYSFSKVAAKLYQEIHTQPREGIVVIPFIVNGVFGIELYLKALATANNSPPRRSHDLTELFDELPPEAKDSIESFRSEAARNWNLPPDTDFRACLIDLKDAFVNWRYAHERENVPELNIPKMIFVLEALHKACTKTGKT